MKSAFWYQLSQREKKKKKKEGSKAKQSKQPFFPSFFVRLCFPLFLEHYRDLSITSKCQQYIFSKCQGLREHESFVFFLFFFPLERKTLSSQILHSNLLNYFPLPLPQHSSFPSTHFSMTPAPKLHDTQNFFFSCHYQGYALKFHANHSNT